MSVFDLNEQNSHIDHKIVAGLERLSQVFKSLLWQQAFKHQLSPIQIQLLIFIHYHSTDKSNVSYLAQEFNITRPTVSDAIKVLEQKKLIVKNSSDTDGRRYSIALTAAGRSLVFQTENYVAPLYHWLSQASTADKERCWNLVVGMISSLNKAGALYIQRSCYNCMHFNNHSCNLLGTPLDTSQIRIDCAEFR